LLPLLAWIQIAGAVQLAIGLANLPLAGRLQYRKNLAGASEAFAFLAIVFGLAATR
jgi:hypothetical protein